MPNRSAGTRGNGIRVVRRPVREEGLVGTLLAPASSGSRPAVVVFGGQEGGLLGEGVAAALAKRGFAALALAYFGIRSLPLELVEIPLEYFAGAVRWLRSQPETDGRRVALMGGSKGGELALLLGAAYPGDVRAVVGYAPSAVVYQGVSFDPWYSVRGVRSPWTYRGEPVPFVDAWPRPFDFVRLTAIPLPAWPFFAVCPAPNYPVSFRRAYERPLEHDGAAVAAATIPVEKIRGPVLLVSGTDDQIWPATRLSEMAVERLRANGHPFPYEHLRYEGVGHMILPPGLGRVPTPPFLEVGGTPQADRRASEDSGKKVLAFLEQHLA